MEHHKLELETDELIDLFDSFWSNLLLMNSRLAENELEKIDAIRIALSHMTLNSYHLIVYLHLNTTVD